MELTWHSCETCPPEEDYNPYLFITNGNTAFSVVWRKECGWYMFGKWHMNPKLEGQPCWWADLKQTVREFNFNNN